MARRKRSVGKRVKADPLFGSERVAQLVNSVMRDGKKSLAQSIVYYALNNLAQHMEKTTSRDIWSSEDLREKAQKHLEEVIDKVGPTVEVRPRRVGGATYQVPIEVGFERRIYLAIRWLVTQGKQRNEKGMVTKLSKEMQDALNEQGGSIEMRKNAHRMAKANEAFAHYQW